MNEEIDNAGVLLQDFTAVSDWEILILRIEELISEWKLTNMPKYVPLRNRDFHKSIWDISEENIEFNAYTIIARRYKMRVEEIEKPVDLLEDSNKYCQALTDLGTFENDFDDLGSSNNNIPQVSTWYGLRDFVVITCDPRNNIREVEIKLLLSTIHIAINNTGCEVPIFIQCMELWQQFFLGVCESKDLCITFNTIHLEKLPSQYHYLIGLIDLFKGKISSSVPLDTIYISSMFTYSLSDFTPATWMQEPPDFDFLQGKSFGTDNFSTLPFGTTLDPIKRIYLYASWLKLSEDTVLDSQSYSDFDPLLASSWSFKMDVEDKLPALLYKYFYDFLNLHKNQLTLKQFLDDVSAVESVIGSSKLSLIKLTGNNKITGEPCLKEGKYNNSIPTDTMRTILQYLLLNQKPEADRTVVDEDSRYVLKASKSRDLVWRLAVLSAHIFQAMGDVNALAHIWYEFSQEMRCRWDNCTRIEGVMEGFPSSRTSLLHQKLQMLNICIDRRKARNAAALHQYSTPAEENSSDSEDEFYECDDENTNDSVTEGKKNSQGSRPLGRLAEFGKDKLLVSGDQMYIPITQEPVVKTEDQLEQDAEVMLTLETGPYRSETIAKIMSSSLLSDMESFKAANPGSIFEDFIRWYSPRDWIEEESSEGGDTKKGHLSARMLIPNNTWVEVWGSAKPIPASRQKRLFDDTKEAEIILHYLESRSVSQIVELLLPSLTQAVLEKLGQECENADQSILQCQTMFSSLKTCAVNVTRYRAEAKEYISLANQVYAIEVLIVRLLSLKLKLGYDKEIISDEDEREFLSSSTRFKEAVVSGGVRGPVGSKLGALFREEAPAVGPPASAGPRVSIFPTPVEKEFVLRAMVLRPSTTYSQLPQVMRAILKHDSCRILGAFTEDSIFN